MMKKKVLSILLSVMMLLGALPIGAMADEAPVIEDGVQAGAVLPGSETETPTEETEEPAAPTEETEQPTEETEQPEAPAEEQLGEEGKAIALSDESTEGVYTFIVPSDATLLVTDTEMYKGVTEFIPVDKAENTPSGMTTYSFAATDTETHCMFRVDGENYITYAGSAYMTAGGSMTITKAMLKPAGQTQTTLDRDPTSHCGVNVCDIYMNINS